MLVTNTERQHVAVTTKDLFDIFCSLSLKLDVSVSGADGAGVKHLQVRSQETFTCSGNEAQTEKICPLCWSGGADGAACPLRQRQEDDRSHCVR